MAIGKVIDEFYNALFRDLNEIFDKNEVYDDNWKLGLFLQIPNLKKIDILEYFEYCISLFTFNGGEEIYSNFMIENAYILDEILLDNSVKPNYLSEYINIIGQLFLANYIEFGMCGLQDKEENLLSKQSHDKYQAWIYFRDNFFYKNAYSRDMLESVEQYGNYSWDKPKYWDMYTFWVARTPKGDKYFNEILAPRFYNKYKDLEVEIDSNGNIIAWYKNGVKI